MCRRRRRTKTYHVCGMSTVELSCWCSYLIFLLASLWFASFLPGWYFEPKLSHHPSNQIRWDIKTCPCRLASCCVSALQKTLRVRSYQTDEELNSNPTYFYANCKWHASNANDSLNTLAESRLHHLRILSTVCNYGVNDAQYKTN